MARKPLTCFMAVLLLAGSLTACSSGGRSTAQSQSDSPEYDKTKTMTLDILHSKEGIAALKDIMKDPSMKQSGGSSESDMSSAVAKTMSSEQGQKLLKQQLQDPKIAASMVKATKKEHEQMLKTLMKDPEYQQSMLSAMKSPEFQSMAVSLLQSPEYRQYTMKVMADSLQNPEFRLMFMDIVKEAIRSGAGVSQMGAQGGGQQGGGQQGQQGGSKQGGQKQGGGGDGGGDEEGGGGGSGGGDGDGGGDGGSK